MAFYEKTNKKYVSEIDKHLAQFDQSHDNSATQQAEIDKYKAVYHKRDHIVKTKKPKDLWDFSE